MLLDMSMLSVHCLYPLLRVQQSVRTAIVLCSSFCRLLDCGSRSLKGRGGKPEA